MKKKKEEWKCDCQTIAMGVGLRVVCASGIMIWGQGDRTITNPSRVPEEMFNQAKGDGRIKCGPLRSKAPSFFE